MSSNDNNEINSNNRINSNTGNEPNPNNEQNTSFFSSFFFRVILMILTMQIVNKFFNKNRSLNSDDQSTDKHSMKNFLSENNIFDIEFYFSPEDNLNRHDFLNFNTNNNNKQNKFIQKILTYENINYNNHAINTTEYTANIEVKFDLEKYKELLLDFDEANQQQKYNMTNDTKIYKKREEIESLYNDKINNKLKQEKIFLYSFIRFKKTNTKVYKNIMKKIEGFKNIDLCVSKINLLKYSETLKKDIQQQKINNDLESADETINNDVFVDNDNSRNIKKYEDSDLNEITENKRYLKHIYYKSEINFYIALFEDKETIESFQELRAMKIHPNFNFHNFEFFPNNFLTEFWNLNTDLKLLMTDNRYNNDNTATMKIKLSFNFLSNFYFKFMKAIEMNSEMMESTFHIPSSKDMFVELLKYNSLGYLSLLFTVNILHTIFSYMGFASDVSYYKNLKELDGVYTKYILFTIFRLLITFLYVCLEDAHFLVKIELFVALVIELWKLRKIFSVSFSFTRFPFVFLNYKIKFLEEKSQSLESESINLMTRYLFAPISILYLSYRIYYYKQTINSSYLKFAIQYLFFLFNLFGFVLMTPQIYINYKLKSVEHLPVKALTYKFLNTIIDDLYAFAVKNTTLYRISCFKDDLIFVIFIIQMVLYRKNKRKVAEENKEDICSNKEDIIKENERVAEEIKDISSVNDKNDSKELDKKE